MFEPMIALRVLVVEDDAMIGLLLLAEMLEEMGYDVCAVTATEEDACAGGSGKVQTRFDDRGRAIK